MPKTVKKVLKLLTTGDKKKLVLLLFINIISSIVGLAGIASVIPFVGLVSNPGFVFKNKYLFAIYHFFNFGNINEFIIFAGIAILLIFVFSNIILAFSAWFNISYTRSISYNLSRSLLRHYLTQQYEFFLKRNSSDLIKNIFSEVGMVIGQVIKPGLELIAKGLMSLFIALFLVYMSPGVAFVVVAVLGGMYGLIYLFIRKKITKSGIVRVRTNKERFKSALEVFGGIKDVKLLGKEQVYLTRYSKYALEFETVQATVQVLTQMPKFVLETIAFGGILLLVISLFVVSGEIQNVLPLIALYTFAGYKLMPAIETIFKALAGIRGNIASLDLLYKEIENYKTYKTEEDEDHDNSRLPFKQRLELNNIIFAYKGMDIPVIDNMTLSIKANTTVGFVGATGCGKTTTIDIILGLLNPRTGGVLVDGVPVIKENLRSWQNQLGYVPQQIYLLDDSIIRNIAFGVSDDEIDTEAVVRAAGIANIQSFIENELPEGYKTIVGERGVRLSGGQRQRIGIARALYYDPAVLVFDEATSALDNITEAAVMDAIDNIMGTKTIIIIAHRLTTVKKCDAIYFMEKGKVIAQGTYDELIESSEEFRKVAGE